MKHRLLIITAILTLMSCRNEEAQRVATEKDAAKNERIFLQISNGWNFRTPPMRPKAQSIANGWPELHAFTAELTQKPRTSIGAFRKKARALSKKAAALPNNIPAPFNRPEIRSRIAVLSTKINSINLFINLQQIPADKVISLVSDANVEMAALCRQMDELVRRSEIPIEEGESDMLRMRDTARAIPDIPPPPAVNTNPQ